MNSIRKIYCRIFQFAFHIALPILPYREPKVYESIDSLIPLFKKLDLNSVLLVTDNILRASGVTSSLEALLAQNNINCAVYDRTSPNPTVHNVEEAYKIYKKEGCEALIAFGGGSCIDCAKATGARIAYPKKSLDSLKGLLRVLRKIPVLIAIPTTAGTGSETTLTAVITDHEKKHKYTMNDFTLIPRFAVLDPSVTYTLPPHLTATTGMDALTHAVEAYIGGSTSRETRRLASEAISLIFNNIEAAYKDGTNAEARRNMLIAAYKAGIAFSKSYVGYIHAIAHTLGGQYNTPHGFANAVIMPTVLEEYGSAAHKKLYRLSVCTGIASDKDSVSDGANKFISEIKRLNRSMNIPDTISEIKDEDIPKMAKYADKEANPLYPVPKLMDAKELEKLYYKISDRS